MTKHDPTFPIRNTLPDGYIECGKALVPWNRTKGCWVAPGGIEIRSRFQADALGWKIHDFMRGVV